MNNIPEFARDGRGMGWERNMGVELYQIFYANGKSFKVVPTSDYQVALIDYESEEKTVEIFDSIDEAVNAAEWGL